MKLRSAMCDTSGCVNGRKKTLVVESDTGHASCRDCDPRGWAEAAERQKDEWLRGG